MKNEIYVQPVPTHLFVAADGIKKKTGKTEAHLISPPRTPPPTP
jgi:hypothetical protein